MIISDGIAQYAAPGGYNDPDMVFFYSLILLF